MSIRIEVSDEVQEALAQKKPIVALESNILTHGLRKPRNLDAAKEFEQTARDNGAIPATIALINGSFHVGLDDEKLHRISSSENSLKISSRDMAAAMSKKHDGGTTVATSIMLSQIVGISVLATGGIGGIHRDAAQSFDISNDIVQLASNQIAVVASGAKSILDIGKTLECFETNSIPVFGWQTDHFPAFYSRKSGHSVPHRFDDMNEMIEAIDIHWNLFPGGILIANPPPSENALEHTHMEQLITQALSKAKEQNILGKATTPFLLKEIHDNSDGKTENLNVELVKSNIRVAAKTAKALCKIPL